MAELDLSGRTLGEFVLREQIGAGGYGAVYRCEQPVLKRDAVVKILHAGRRRNNTAKERFLREAQLASRLDHPYAAHVYSFGAEDDGLLWIAMELVQGITLGDLLKSRGPMPLDQFVPFFECVAQVVQAAHERGIVHRDLKPSNIMVIESGDRLFPKLLDFGIAKLNDDTEASEVHDEDDEPVADAPADRAATVRIRVTPQRVQRTRTDSKQAARLTRRGAVIGSAPYMSPEQWGDPCAVGPASDIYSLGCVAYEALTGHAPFSAANTDEYYQRHLHADPPSLGNAFSPELDRVLQRALAKAPEARHASAPELAAEFHAVLRAQPREQLRSAALHWQDRARLPSLLWGRDVLAEVERWAQPPAAALTELECSFVAASQQRARRIRWVRRTLGVLAAAGVLGALAYRSAMQADLAEQRARLAEQQTRAAQQLAEVRVTQSELEQGRAALLHGESEAQGHLTEAYRRDPSPSTAFMLARSIQPRLMEQARLASTHGRMLWAAFSPDGAQIVTADDRNAQIWDGRTYRLLRTLPHGCKVNYAEYSPGGAILVTAGEANVRIWDPASGALLRELKARPGGGPPVIYYRAAMSRDGKLVAAIDETGAVVDVWNAASGALVTELRSRGGDFPRLAFSPDGWLAITGGDELRVFDPHTWTQVLTIPGRVHGLAFDAHSRLVTGTATGDVAIWSLPGGARLQHLRPSGESVDAVAFSPDGELIVAGSLDGTMQIWHASTGTLQSRLNPRRSKIADVEFDPTSTRVLAASADGTVVIADAEQGLAISVLEGPRNIIRMAHFDASSHRVIGASWDGSARVWDASSPYRRWSSAPVGESCSMGLGAAVDERFVAVGCRDLPTQIWDTAHDQRLAKLPSVTPVPGDDFASAAPAVSATGDRAAIARGSDVQVYELPGGRLLRTIAHAAPVSAVAFGGLGRDLVTGAVDGSLIVTRDAGATLALTASGAIDVAELLPDGRLIASDAQRRLRIYDVSGAVLADLELPARMMSLRHDGARLIALADYARNTAAPLLIDLMRPRIVAQLEGHVGYVFSARWFGGRIVTAGADGTARLWDGTSGQLVRIYRGGSRFLADAIIAFDGLLIGGDGDGVLRFWDMASGARLWTLQAHKSAVIAVHMDGDDLVTRGFTGEISRWRFPRSEQVIDGCSEQPRCAIVAQ
jgi:eukaryotic-like serine/threonine-protein kinase